jgi:hypothetical protein
VRPESTINRVDEVVERLAVHPSRQQMRRWERNWDPSFTARNFDPVECGFLMCRRIVCTLSKSSDNVPNDLLLSWPGLTVSVLDRFDNNKMCACVAPCWLYFVKG